MKTALAGLLAVVAVAIAPQAAADPNSDFLGCLANHQVTYSNTRAMLNLGAEIEHDLRVGWSEQVVVNNLVNYHDTTLWIAKVDVACVEATMLMGSS